MTETSLDLIPVSQLPSRYSINRSVVYTRLKELKIKPQKIGKQSFINATELDLLDKLDKHLKNGGITSEFLATNSSVQDENKTQDKIARQVQDELPDNSQTNRDYSLHGKDKTLNKLDQDSNQTHSPTLTRQTGQDISIEQIIQGTIIQTLSVINQQNNQIKTTLSDLETLQKVLDNNWLLTTNKIAEIIGLSPKTISKKK
jgi:lambda repressor-like predicted transcriptional regulator